MLLRSSYLQAMPWAIPFQPPDPQSCLILHTFLLIPSYCNTGNVFYPSKGASIAGIWALLLRCLSPSPSNFLSLPFASLPQNPLSSLAGTYYVLS